MKTREEFLLILRFMPLYKSDFCTFLVMIKPQGRVFFNKFVGKGHLFDAHKVLHHRHSLKYPKSYLSHQAKWPSPKN